MRRAGMLVAAAALILSACAGAQDEPQGDGGGHGEHAEKMGGGHGAMLTEGNYSDRRFIDLMVPHHRGAVQMSRVALENAEHEEVRRLAQNIIRSQRAEIEELRDIRRQRYGTSRVPTQMDQGEMQMMGMTDPQELAGQEPFDGAFIDAMIPHHRSAIEMARVAREQTENPRIRRLAEDIIREQQREIEQMRRWREEWYPEG
jgi:uncharacterized protein (DUF305 family)